MTGKPIHKVVSCMGQPVAGNPTEFMFERAFAAAGVAAAHAADGDADEHLAAPGLGHRHALDLSIVRASEDECPHHEGTGRRVREEC